MLNLVFFCYMVYVCYKHPGSSAINWQLSLTCVMLTLAIFCSRFPPRSTLNSQRQRISPSLAKARKMLQDNELQRQTNGIIKARREAAASDKSASDKNVHFRLEHGDSEDEDEDEACEQYKTSLSSSTAAYPEYSINSSSNSNPEEYISQDPNQLFLPMQRVQTVSEASMEQFRQRVLHRNMIENLELAPYKVLLDEYKELPPGKYPGHGAHWNSVDDVSLPELSRQQQKYHQRAHTSTPQSSKPRHSALFRSRSDAFFQESLHRATKTPTPGQRKSALAPRHSIASSLDGKQSMTSLSNLTSSTDNRISVNNHRTNGVTLKTRPVTHAMLKREKTQINAKIGSFLNKLDTERSARESSRPRSTPNKHTSEAAEQDITTTSPKPMDTQQNKTTAANKGTAISSLSNGLATTPSSSPRKQQGLPVHAAARSQRHTATFKLRRIVESLMQKKSKKELLEMDRLRNNSEENHSAGEQTGAPAGVPEGATTEHEDIQA